MRKRDFETSSWLAVGLVLAVSAGPALAQDAGTSGQVEDIVVTAQFREQSLQSTPLAITAVSSAMMEARS